VKRLRKWNVNLVSKKVHLSPKLTPTIVKPLEFQHVGVVEGHSWREAQKNALREFGHLATNTHQVFVAAAAYKPTSWEKLLDE
jgi:hypothetical protein